MARFALLLICFAVLFQSAQRTWIVASWKVNQSYIASTLCEKRMEQNSCCAGSCYLGKQLEENEAREESAPLNEKERVEYVSDLFGYTFTFLSSYYTSAVHFPILWTDGNTKGFNSSIFHPPSLVG